MSVTALPIPPHHRSVEDVLATAARAGFEKIVIMGETAGDFLVLNNDLTAAELVYFAEKAKNITFNGPRE
jgi:hypothetical protein